VDEAQRAGLYTFRCCRERTIFLPMGLPARIDVLEFDSLHDRPQAWRGAVEALAAELGVTAAEVRQEISGTVLVARLGSDRVLKLYPPFLHDHFAFERAMLERLHGRLRVPTPKLLAHGERDGWPYTVMSQLTGEPLTAAWPRMGEAARCALLRELGTLAAEVHALPAQGIESLAPRWDDFIARQRERCIERQRRTGLPPHLLAQVPAFIIGGPLPEGEPVLLTGEYTPMNLFVDAGERLCAMFDFGDGLIGPREYDWLGPMCFLAAGQPAQLAAFFGGYGVTLTEPVRLVLLRMLLLHRYSHLPAQIALPGWQKASDFEQLAALIWPL
jgi:hygromycin-B 7''-O-kinase